MASPKVRGKDIGRLSRDDVSLLSEVLASKKCLILETKASSPLCCWSLSLLVVVLSIFVGGAAVLPF